MNSHQKIMPCEYEKKKPGDINPVYILALVWILTLSIVIAYKIHKSRQRVRSFMKAQWNGTIFAYVDSILEKESEIQKQIQLKEEQQVLKNEDSDRVAQLNQVELPPNQTNSNKKITIDEGKNKIYMNQMFLQSFFEGDDNFDLVDENSVEFRQSYKLSRKRNTCSSRYRRWILKYCKYIGYFWITIGSLMCMPVLYAVGSTAFIFYPKKADGEINTDYNRLLSLPNFIYMLFVTVAYIFIINIIYLSNEMVGFKQKNFDTPFLGLLVYSTFGKAFKIGLLITFPVFIYSLCTNTQFFVMDAKNSWYWLIKDGFILMLLDKSLGKSDKITNNASSLRGYNIRNQIIHNISKYFPQENLFLGLIRGKIIQSQIHQVVDDVQQPQLLKKGDKRPFPKENLQALFQKMLKQYCKDARTNLNQSLKIIDQEEFNNITVNQIRIQTLKKFAIVYFYFSQILTVITAIGFLIPKNTESCAFDPIITFLCFFPGDQYISSILYSLNFIFFGPLSYLLTQTDQLFSKQDQK